MQNVAEKIIAVITANFPNGIRDDFIDTTKFLRIYAANYADEDISRDLIGNVIRANSLENGGRFYFVSDGDSQKILRLVDEILGTHPIVYYSAVYGKHTDFFAQLKIFSPDVLKKILQAVDDVNIYFDEFYSAYRSTWFDYEIAKIFMTAEKSLSLDDLQSRLPYVPSEKILAVLSDTKKFLLKTDGKFISRSNSIWTKLTPPSNR